MKRVAEEMLFVQRVLSDCELLCTCCGTQSLSLGFEEYYLPLQMQEEEEEDVPSHSTPYMTPPHCYCSHILDMTKHTIYR